jgi:peptidyl-prolyl cis-trans isomerase B (cyclophilin B)
VQGKIQNDSLLEKNEKRINRQIIKKITDSILSLSNNKKIKADFERIKNIGATNNDSLQILQKKIDELVELTYQNYPKYKITEEQRRTYKKIGGTPHLDTHYTVFGDVYEGLDILDKIIINKTDKNDRPLQDIRMWINILK